METKFARSFNEKVHHLISEEKEREYLYSVLQHFQSEPDVKKLTEELRFIINDPERLLLYNEIRPLIPAKHQMDYDRLGPRRDMGKMRIIRLTRRSSEGLGFSVRGGLEHDVGIYVSDVEPDSLAHRRGLRIGDEIVRLNGFTISQAIHQEVLNLIKARNELVLKVRNVGMLPVRDKPSALVTWRYVDVDPQQNGTALNKTLTDNNTVGEEINLYINIPLHGGLGCSICSGPRHHPGIFIQSLKRGGLAQEAGLEVGDQIIKVNDTTFSNVTHSQAIVAFKGSKHLDMIIRKGTGLDLFQHGKDLDLDISDPVDDGTAPRHRLKDSKDKHNQRKTRHSAGQDDAATEKDAGPDNLVEQALKVIDVKGQTKVRSRPEVKDHQINTVAEVHHVQRSTSASKAKTWIFKDEERLRDDGENMKTVKRERSTRKSQDTDRQAKKERKSSKSRNEQERGSRMYRKNHDMPVVAGQRLSSTSPIRAKEGGTSSPPAAFDEERVSERHVTRRSTERHTSDYGASHRMSTGFDKPPPFPEATTDFRESPTDLRESPPYDTTIPSTHVKILNPKIYKPIEIQNLHDQIPVRPNKSPTYLSEVQNNYRIQKPVLLHPTHAQPDRRASYGSQGPDDALASSSTFYSGGDFNSSQLLTNEQIAGRQIQHISVNKAGCTDLGILIESNLDRIIVAEIYRGGAIHKQRGVQVGDQLMMVEQHLLIGMAIERVHTLLKQEYKSPKPTLELVVAKAPPNELVGEVLPRPDYFDIPISNLDDFLDEDDVEICMYNDDVPVTII